MKKVFVYGLWAVLAVTGCQNEQELFNQEDNNEQEPAKVFTAIVDEDFGKSTKTSLDGSGNVLWKIGDQVSIFAASTANEQYQVSDASDGKTSATLNKIPSGVFVAGTEINNNVAFYPYASTAELAKNGDDYVISEIELPATQTYVAGSFGNGAFPMAAVTSSTEDMNLRFKNVLGGLKLQLKGTATITSISVTGNNNEILCGDAVVTTTYGGVPTISLSDASAKTVTLDCGAGVTLDSETATPFIIALPPMTMTGGFTVVVTDSESKQMEIKTTRSQTITRSNLLKMPAVNYVGTALAAPLKLTSTGAMSISLTQTGSPDAISLEYKVDDGAWADYTIGLVVSLTDGQELSFRAGASGNSSFSQSNTDYYKFTFSGSGEVAASGNIMSLIERTGSLTIPSSCCFIKLFSGCNRLTAAPELPATTLTDRCYASMFSECYLLTAAPELPATTLTDECYASMFYKCYVLTPAPELPATTLAYGCYSSMFSGCYLLTTAPELPATTLARQCYSSMFQDCANFTTAPTLPATNLAQECYLAMFKGCTSLETAPSLPATTLAVECYAYMFHGCTSLTSAPYILPATTLTANCYHHMFYGCTSLTTAPILPAPTLALYCYQMMFNGCSSLNYVKALFTSTPVDTYTSSWLSGVSASGTFVKSKDATWNTRGADAVPTGWTIIKE